MKQHQCFLRRLTVSLLLVLAVSQIPSAAWAVSSNVVSETQGKTELTVSQIKDLAVLYNPTNKTYALNQKNLDLSQTTTSNDLRSAQNSLNSSYDVDTSSVTAIQAQIDQLLSQYESEAEMPASAQGELTLLRQQLSQAEAAVGSAYASMESSFQGALNNIEQLNNTLDSYDDQQDDLDKTVADWETQVRMIAEVLCMQATQYEKTIQLLEGQITLAEKSLQLAKVQQELGMALTTDVQSSQVSLEEAQQSLETARENLSSVKGQINVLIGRAQNSALEVTPMSVPTIVSQIPAYSDSLVQEVIDNDYTLKTYERSIANYKEEVEDETDSDTLQAADNKIAAVKLNIEERERTLADKVKTQLNKMTADKASLETSQTKVVTEQKNLAVAQQKYELGMLTASQLLQSELDYQSAALTHWNDSYQYYLDWQEFKALKAGTDTSTYASYRL